MRSIQTLRQPTVAAFGEWSETNIGDHAIHEGVREFFGDCGWRVRSFDLGSLRPSSGPPPAAVAQPYGADADRRISSVLDALPAAKRTLRAVRQHFLIQNLLPSLEVCDAICVGGGALLMDSNLHFPQSLAALTWAARELNKPLLCLGCSVEGDWSTQGRRMVRDFLTRCEFIALRDDASAERVSNLLGRDVPIFGDFALRMSAQPPVDAPSRPPSRYLLAANATHLLAPYDHWRQRHEDGVVALVTRAVAQPSKLVNSPANFPARIAVFTTGTPQDAEPAARLCKRLAFVEAELHLGRSLDQLRELLGASRAVVAARLHAAIIGLAERVPAIGYSATPKLGNFFHSVGLDDCHFGPSDATDLAVSRLLQLLQNGQTVPTAASTTVHRTREATRKYLDGLTLAIRYGEVAGL